MYLRHRPELLGLGRFPRTRGDVPASEAIDRPRSTFPRTRGDVPLHGGLASCQDLFPPHTRGCTVKRFSGFFVVEVSPAHAGMYPVRAFQAPTAKSFPRTRGDVPAVTCPRNCSSRFPPHTRGCTPVSPTGKSQARVSPAHAGMYRTPRERVRHLYCFPRTRGDVPLFLDGSDL